MNVTVPDRRWAIQVEIAMQEVLPGPGGDTWRYNYKVNNVNKVTY